MYCYSIAGLSVSSDIVLPGLIVLADRPTCPDVEIRAGLVLATLDAPIHTGPNWQMDAGCFLIAIPDIVSIMVRGGRELIYAPQPGGTAADAVPFIAGSAFGILLHQRGRVVLHASAVRVRDSAILFCGPSGAGKSTLAAALVDAGHDLITDDFCGIHLDPHGIPWVQPDGRQLKLWQNSIDCLSLGPCKAAPVRLRLEKFYVEPRSATSAALPVAAVYVLREARPPIVPGIDRPNLVDGALLVRRNAYRPGLVQRMGQQQLYFHAAAMISEHAAVFTLARKMEFACLPETMARLEAHWRMLGLADIAA